MMMRNRSFFFLLMVITALAAALIMQAAPQAAPSGSAAQTPPARAASQPQAGQEGPPPQPSHDKPAEQVYRNIKVLTALPSDQVIESMQTFRAALGVECDFCHVRQNGRLMPPLDDKKEKQTARQMITMVKSINDANFNGRPQVTCATCHQGHNEPRPYPPVAELEKLKARLEAEQHPVKREDLPSADSLFDKYEQAIGGAAAVAKLTTKVAKATATLPSGATVQVEAYLKAPDRALSIQSTQQGSQWSCFDGSKAWVLRGRQLQTLEGPEAEQVKLQADFYRDLKLKGRYTRAVTASKDKINEHEVYVVRGQLPNTKFQEQLFFDAQTGLLLRRTTLTRTPFGPVPETQDFDDYREVNGVKVAYTVKIARPDNVVVRKLTELSFNTPVDDAKFAPPAQQ